jgi:hypothetical protein
MSWLYEYYSKLDFGQFYHPCCIGDAAVTCGSNLQFEDIIPPSPDFKIETNFQIDDQTLPELPWDSPEEFLDMQKQR